MLEAENKLESISLWAKAAFLLVGEHSIVDQVVQFNLFLHLLSVLPKQGGGKSLKTNLQVSLLKDLVFVSNALTIKI